MTTTVNISRIVDNFLDLLHSLTSLVLPDTEERQVQHVRQSTLLAFIAVLKIVAGFIAFETFLLLWKINYYTVSDPYATAG